MNKLGERIRHRRKRGGITLKVLSGCTGLSVSYLSDIERGRTNPSLKTLNAIASSFGMEAWEFLAPEDVVKNYRMTLTVITDPPKQGGELSEDEWLLRERYLDK